MPGRFTRGACRGASLAFCENRRADRVGRGGAVVDLMTGHR